MIEAKGFVTYTSSCPPGSSAIRNDGDADGRGDGTIWDVPNRSVRVQIREGVATMIPEIQGEGPGCPAARAEETTAL